MSNVRINFYNQCEKQAFLSKNEAFLLESLNNTTAINIF